MFKLLKVLMSLVMFTSFVVEPTPGGNEKPNDDEPAPADKPVDNPDEEINEAELSKSITKDESRLELMQEEYTKMADTIHDEFEAIVSKSPEDIFTAEELDILEVSGNLAEKNKLFRDKFEEFRNEKLSLKKDEIDGFSKELGNRRKQHSLIQAQNIFLKQNPNVDMEKFANFIQGDLTPNQKSKFLEEAKDDKNKFLELAFAEFKKQNPTEEEDEQLPPDLNGLNGESASKYQDLDKQGRDEYLKSIGLA